MQLAVNYSPQAVGLLQANIIAFDRWKCSDWPDLIADARPHLPVYVHFDLQAGPGTAGGGDLDRVAAFVADTDTPYINLHLAPGRADYPDIPVESREPTHLDAVAERTLRDIGAVAARFGPARVIAENLPYRGPDGKRLRMGAEVTFIRRLCDAAGCGFLLDVAHARTAAHHLGLDARTYLSALPVDRLCELHVSGVDRDDEGHLREHMPLGDDDWALLQWCLDAIYQGLWARPWVLALEYGGIGPLFAWRSEASVLADQVPRLAELVRDLKG